METGRHHDPTTHQQCPNHEVQVSDYQCCWDCCAGCQADCPDPADADTLDAIAPSSPSRE